MKKINFIVACLLMLSVKLWSQPVPSEGMTDYDKIKVPCYTIEVPFSEDVATDAIKKRFKKMGAGGKERKGFLEFKNVSIPEVRNELVDAYIKIEQKSKKEKNISIVSMVLTEPGVVPGASDSTLSSSKGAGTAIAAAGALGLLSSLHENTSDHSLELEIKKQEEMVKKADKEYNSLIKDGDDLQNKLKKIQNDIEANRNNQTKQAEELKKQKETLLQIQARRRMVPGEKNN